MHKSVRVLSMPIWDLRVMVVVTEAKHALLSPQQTSQCMWLMQALGFLLSALPVEEILRNLHSLITPYIQQLEKLADETVCTHDSHLHTLTHLNFNGRDMNLY